MLTTRHLPFRRGRDARALPASKKRGAVPAAAKRMLGLSRVGAALFAAGCAARAPESVPAPRAAAATQAVDASTVPSIATLPLDQILPAAKLPAPASTRPSTGPSTAPTTAPADRPPLDAVLLYAQVTDHLAAGRRLVAIELLQRAIALDPDSFELHYALGRAYARDGGGPDARALAELERAAEINPDHLRLQTELGRLYLAGGDDDRGLWHLRLALQTGEYQTDDAGAAISELLLGRALARKGYHAAAVEVYERLMGRLETPGMAIRGHPETAFLLARPELLKLQAAESYERIGRIGPALAAYQSAARRDPGSMELRARVVRALVGLKRLDDAASEAADAVAYFHGNPAAVDLLRDVCRAMGREGAVVDELRRLQRRRPRDRAVVFALADVMRAEGRAPEAQRLLRAAAESSPADPEIVRRVYEHARDADPAGRAAARFLVDWSARFPDAVHLLGDHWDDLLRPVGVRRLGLRELAALTPPADVTAAARGRWDAAKEFWVAHVARLRHRRDVARAALERAAAATPPYPPALRSWAGWDREALGLTGDERASLVEQLAERAGRDGGNGALAEELRALLLISAGDFPGARRRLARAVELGGSSPELQFALAVAARGAGDEAAFEQGLWKLVSDWPGYDEGYEALYNLYEARGSGGASEKVLGAWLAADAQSVPARLAQVREQLRAGRTTAAQGLAQRLFAERPGDARVLGVLRATYGQGQVLEWLLTQLQRRHAAAPGDLAPVAQLIDILAEHRRQPEATRALDATRAALARDPDLLYQVAHLYARLGQKATTNQVLRDVLAAEPAHAAAANDLGYAIAEEGGDLGQAEELARRAVDAEPANGSFLDSLGWVLYKRGRLDEARKHLDRAASASPQPDPVVLDHLGDTLYRQGDAAAAGAQWKRASQRLAEMPADETDRDDLKQLRLQLERKARQLEAGQPVSVAPAEEAAPRPARGATLPARQDSQRAKDN
jgi:predicted Zn-dependent protease